MNKSYQSYQQAFIIFPEKEQVVIRNLHNEEAMKIQEQVVSFIQNLHELGYLKREQEVVDFLFSGPNQNASKNTLATLSDSIIKLLCSPVDFLDMTPRSSNCCKAQSINYIGDLCTIDELHLLRIPNLGRKSIKEIEQVLAGHGLTLDMNIPNWDELRPKE